MKKVDIYICKRLNIVYQYIFHGSETTDQKQIIEERVCVLEKKRKERVYP